MRTVLVTMLLLLCFPLVTRAQKNAGYELFMQTIRRLDIKSTKQLIAQGVNVNLTDSHGRTALFDLPYLYDFDKEKAAAIAGLLITSGADVNARSKNGETPLFEAVRMHAVKIVALLITAGADAGIVSGYNQSVLNAAVYVDDPEILNLVWNALPEINLNHVSTRDALEAALKTGYIEAIDKFLQRDNRLFAFYWDKLFIENFKGNITSVENMLSQGGEVKKRDDKNRDVKTVLTLAV